MIRIKAQLEVSASTEYTVDQAEDVLHQIARDAACGTFAQFPDFWKDKWEHGGETQYASIEPGVDQIGKNQFAFTLRIASSLFDPLVGGFQHLVSMIGGDLFRPRLPGVKVNFTITEVSLPENMTQAAVTRFRRVESAGTRRANSVDDIRRLFRLKDDEPLLAFTFKPRLGIRIEEFETVVLGVLRAGFHLVEVDTRDLRLDEERIKKLIDISRKAAEINAQHVTRLSVNLSLPAHRICDIAQRFEGHVAAPVVVKVDGGLDGISAIQALRERFLATPGTEVPIVTCYPLLRDSIGLLGKGASRLLVEVLGHSGADIIYPGGRPTIGIPGRELGVEPDALVRSIRDYYAYSRIEYPMASLAGGIYPGQLHAYYELLGPRFAFFLGGAVALHQDGPIEGARLCRDILNGARAARAKAGPGNLASDLDVGLMERVESYVGNEAKFNYVPITSLIGKNERLLQFFMERWTQ